MESALVWWEYPVDNLISYPLKYLVSYKGIIFQIAQGSKTGTSSIMARNWTRTSLKNRLHF